MDLKNDLIYEEMRNSAQITSHKNRKASKSDLNRKEIEPKNNDDIYMKYLEIIQRHILKKQKKDLSINVEKRVKLISPFQVTTENHQNCMKSIILIRVCIKLNYMYNFPLYIKVKNNLKNVIIKDPTSFTYPITGKSKNQVGLCFNDPRLRKINMDKDLNIYAKNIEFMLSNSSCKSIYNPSTTESYQLNHRILLK